MESAGDAKEGSGPKVELDLEAKEKLKQAEAKLKEKDKAQLVVLKKYVGRVFELDHRLGTVHPPDELHPQPYVVVPKELLLENKSIDTLCGLEMRWAPSNTFFPGVIGRLSHEICHPTHLQPHWTTTLKVGMVRRDWWPVQARVVSQRNLQNFTLLWSLSMKQFLLVGPRGARQIEAQTSSTPSFTFSKTPKK
jgi:hypothetical protein